MNGKPVIHLALSNPNDCSTFYQELSQDGLFICHCIESLKQLELSTCTQRQSVYLLDSDFLCALIEEFSLVQTILENSKFIVLSSRANLAEMSRAVQLGASAYVKTSASLDIIHLVQTVLNGVDLFEPDLLKLMTVNCAPRVLEIDSEFTFMEQRILIELAYGLSNKKISEKLNISINTVKTHLRNIFKKIGVADRTQAALWVWQISQVQDHPIG